MPIVHALWPGVLFFLPGFLIECLNAVYLIKGRQARKHHRPHVSALPIAAPIINIIGFSVGYIMGYRLLILVVLLAIGWVVDFVMHIRAYMNLFRAAMSKEFWSTIFQK